MTQIYYKGFRIRLIGTESYSIEDGQNSGQFLDGRRNIVEKPKGLCFFYATVMSAKRAIDRYQETYPDDPVFHGRWPDTPRGKIPNRFYGFHTCKSNEYHYCKHCERDMYDEDMDRVRQKEDS